MSWLGQFDDFGACQGNLDSTSFKGKTGNSILTSNYGMEQREPCAIQDLNPGTPNVVIIGLVIAKEEPREVTTKSNRGTTRFVLNFVVRDSVSCYITVTSWGSDGFIKDLANTFHTNDVVEIYNPQIQTKPTDGADKFRPWTPSLFHLNLSETHSSVKPYTEWDSSNYSSLQHVPIRPANDYYTLNDIIVNGQGISGEHVNIQAAVRNVGAVKEMVTKKGRNAKRCEVKLFDESCPSFPLILWDNETINQGLQWNPGEYVLFASDVRVYHDDFRNCMAAAANSKTIFIINPDTKEAHSLYMFAQSQNLNIEPADQRDNSIQKDLEISEIKEVVSVRGAKQMEEKVCLGSPYFCKLYAYVTQFDIDQETRLPIRYKCPKCKQSLDDNQQVCLNPSCIENSTSGQFTAELQYDIPITLSDHTGSITNWRLNHSAAEEIIAAQPESFMEMTGNQKTSIKWKYLLERCKVYLKIQRGRNNGKTFCRVLSIAGSEPTEVQGYLNK